MKNELWTDTRLSEEAMKFLNDAISEKNKENHSDHLAGNISKSEIIIDKDNWFFESILKKQTERLFYRDWDNYYNYHIEKAEPPKYRLGAMWVNYQKQYEFNPPHGHAGAFSFTVFMKIPTHWKEQHALPISVNSNCPVASDFQFIMGRGHMVATHSISLSPEDEGRLLVFPAWLLHQVFPFYGTEEDRITISGNVSL